MHVRPLSSGSQGNATLVVQGDTRILVDAGLHADALTARLAAIGLPARRIDAIVVTHRHKDHVRGTTDFAAAHRCKVYGTRRTLRSVGSEVAKRKHTIVPGRRFGIGELEVLAFPVPHDAPDTVGLRVSGGGAVYGHATDLGSWDATVVAALDRCDELLLEFNHDRALLEGSDDPLPLRERIAGDEGHLSNAQAAALLGEVAWPGLRRVFLAHLSARNNTVGHAVEAARGALRGAGVPAELVVALQDAVTPV